MVEMQKDPMEPPRFKYVQCYCKVKASFMLCCSNDLYLFAKNVQ